MRIFSAIIAGGGLVATYLFFSVKGIYYGSFLVSLLAIGEYNRLVFQDIPHRVVRILLFPIFGAILLTSSLSFPHYFGEVWSLFLTLFICIYIWLYGSKKPNDWLFYSLTKAAIGFLYVVLLPVMVIKLLDLNAGEIWFLLLLLMVFCGDIFAYFGGRQFGRRMLSPSLSPKKTMEGSFFGLVGSSLPSLVIWYWHFEQIPALLFVNIALLAGLLAQTGDLFESLIKRIANVKDSGGIMPGHGGVLDRIDGVLFASPIVYVFAYNAEKFLIY